MNEDFEFNVTGFGDLADIGKAQFASQHHTVAPQRLGQQRALGTGDRHLSAAVNLQTWRNFFDQLANTDVLSDHSVDAGVGHCNDGGLGEFKFMVKHKRVKSDESFDAALMECLDRFG